MKIKPNFWLAFLLIGLATLEIIDLLIRPKYGVGEGVIPFLLGVLPNFFAAGLIFPFAVLTFRDYYTSEQQKASRKNLAQWFWAGMAITQIGLISWELIQLKGKLIFDWNDIGATLLGGVLAIALFSFLSR